MPSPVPFSVLDAVLPQERLLHASDIVCLGVYRCRPDEPAFAGGACSGHTVVFPRRAVGISQAGRRAFIADALTVPLYNRGQAYERTAIDPRGDACEWIAFSTVTLMAALAGTRHDRGMQADAPFAVSHLRARGEVYAAQRRLFSDVRAGWARDAFEIDARALAILDGLLADPHDVEPDGRARDAVEEARRLVNLDRSGRLGLSGLAAACGLTPFQLCRQFRRHTGRTITAYRRTLRLFESLESLPRAHDLSALALTAGFCSHSHYGAAFRRTFGATPSQMRTALGGATG